MCHGHVDAKLVELDVLDRVGDVRASRDVTARDGRVPPELSSGLQGVWARLSTRMLAVLRGRAVT